MKRYILAVVVVLVLAALACGESADRTPTPDVGSRYGAYAICKEFVADRLVSPTTAEFPKAAEMTIKQVDVEADQWRVVGYVDSQNRMGAMLRADFACVVTYKGDDVWGLDDLEIVPR